jgi:hypothetical protein
MSEDDKQKPEEFSAELYRDMAFAVGFDDLDHITSARGGFVYVAYNEDVVKIGKTENHPKERMKQLNTTGVVHDWECWGWVWSLSASALERYLHDMLDDYRIRSDREFFDVDPVEAVKFLDFCHHAQTWQFLKKVHGPDCDFAEFYAYDKELMEGDEEGLDRDHEAASQLKLVESGSNL